MKRLNINHYDLFDLYKKLHLKCLHNKLFHDVSVDNYVLKMLSLQDTPDLLCYAILYDNVRPSLLLTALLKCTVYLLYANRQIAYIIN